MRSCACAACALPFPLRERSAAFAPASHLLRLLPAPLLPAPLCQAKAKATVLHGSGCIHLSAGSLASARQCFNEALELNRLLRGELAPNGEPPHQVAANLKGLQYAAQLVDADGDGC